ncbi:RNase H domain-containing protein [Trichonephila clavipes]|nr:RNase H domain-containing protein [Trichonephila clavipes]
MRISPLLRCPKLLFSSPHPVFPVGCSQRDAPDWTMGIKARKWLNNSGRDWGADAGTLRNTYNSLIRNILEYGGSFYCSTSITNHQKLEKVQLSTARIITCLKNTCPRDIVLFEVDLQPFNLGRRECLTKYYSKLRSLDSRNRTSAYFKEWCNNQRLRRNNPFSHWCCGTSSPVTMS